MKLLFFAIACAGGMMALHAQAELFKQAPPDVDQSLRTRVNKFYQAYVDGKPRTALPLVAEDTQDLWFDTDKPKYKKFELLKIAYSEDFRKANVTVMIDEGMTQHLPDSITRIPMTTTWRIDNGQWVYYVDMAVRGTKVTPFGQMKAGPGETGHQSGLSRMLDKSPILANVKLDKNEVHLGLSDEIAITNGMPGGVNLRLEMDKLDGLSGTLEQSYLAANAQTKVRFEYSGSATEGKAPLQAKIIIQETQQVIPIKIMFQ